MVRLLADESVDFGVVRALRDDGFDVLAVVELDPGIADREVATRAFEDDRILLTEDKDFGHLVYATGASAHGVLLVRFAGGSRDDMIASVLEVVRRYSDRLADQFVVVQPGKIRFSKFRGS
ncbi:MAG: DUF5615 family PIN-like protein [Acidobacteriota bacterium]|nr:DUF5615 family PIN-like protein [Acidobacteriota bacterium]